MQYIGQHILPDTQVVREVDVKGKDERKSKEKEDGGWVRKGKGREKRSHLAQPSTGDDGREEQDEKRRRKRRKNRRNGGLAASNGGGRGTCCCGWVVAAAAALAAGKGMRRKRFSSF